MVEEMKEIDLTVKRSITNLSASLTGKKLKIDEADRNSSLLDKRETIMNDMDMTTITVVEDRNEMAADFVKAYKQKACERIELAAGRFVDWTGLNLPLTDAGMRYFCEGPVNARLLDVMSVRPHVGLL